MADHNAGALGSALVRALKAPTRSHPLRAPKYSWGNRPWVPPIPRRGTFVKLAK